LDSLAFRIRSAAFQACAELLGEDAYVRLFEDGRSGALDLVDLDPSGRERTPSERRIPVKHGRDPGRAEEGDPPWIHGWLVLSDREVMGGGEPTDGLLDP